MNNTAMGLTEIRPQHQEDGLITEAPCPRCYRRMTYGLVPCPDGKSGCCVAHYGYHCSACGRYFH